MAIEKLNENLNFISALADEPNDIDGISAAELKARFDAAGNIIKNYINDSLVPGIEREIVSEVSDTSVKSGNMPAFGLAGQRLGKKSDEDFDWEFVTPHEIPAGGMTGHALIKRSGDDYDALFQPIYAGRWCLLESFLTAGVYTWTAPDARSNGMPYEIGVFIVGGGGSGGLAATSGAHNLVASGGAGGYTASLRKTVAPGESMGLVVGAGGTPYRIDNIGSTNTSIYSGDGLAGGSSSFAGCAAEGGGGGKAYGNTYNTSNVFAVPGADGGQGSDAAAANYGILASGSSYSRRHLIAPARGMPSSPTVYMNSHGVQYITFFPGGRTVPGMCVNPFTGEYMLAAGGFAAAYNYSCSFQAAYVFDDGTGGGSGLARQWDGLGGDSVAPPATAVGSGGGGIIGIQTSNIAIVSGAGADGGVFIYVREGL